VVLVVVAATAVIGASVGSSRICSGGSGGWQ